MRRSEGQRATSALQQPPCPSLLEAHQLLLAFELHLELLICLGCPHSYLWFTWLLYPDSGQMPSFPGHCTASSSLSCSLPLLGPSIPAITNRHLSEPKAQVCCLPGLPCP